jgi:hypothetical protein
LHWRKFKAFNMSRCTSVGLSILGCSGAAELGGIEVKLAARHSPMIESRSKARSRVSLFYDGLWQVAGSRLTVWFEGIVFATSTSRRLVVDRGGAT